MSHAFVKLRNTTLLHLADNTEDATNIQKLAADELGTVRGGIEGFRTDGDLFALETELPTMYVSRSWCWL